MAAVDYYNTGDDASAQASNTRWIAQTFTASITYSINSVKLKLWRDVTLAPGIVTASIRATTSGLPSGTDLCSGTTDGDTLPTTAGTAEWREITFGSPANLTSGTVYSIVLRCAGSGSYPLNWRSDNSSPTYSGGSYCYSSDSGSSWTALTSADMMFETYSAVTYVDISGIIAGTSDLSGTLTLSTQVNIAGTIAGISTVGGVLGAELILSSDWQIGDEIPTKRLIQIGNNALWYEDI